MSINGRKTIIVLIIISITIITIIVLIIKIIIIIVKIICLVYTPLKIHLFAIGLINSIDDILTNDGMT